MSHSRPIVLLGSSRREGETRRAVDLAFGDKADFLDLHDFDFSPFDYRHANRDDDFLKIIDLVIPKSTIVFATPVYWYSMSAGMKTFFDRLSDLITMEKSKGRALAGKSVWLIATGTEKIMPEGFENPFSETSAYFDMIYRGACYLYTGRDAELRRKTEKQLVSFGRKVLRESRSAPKISKRS